MGVEGKLMYPKIGDYIAIYKCEFFYRFTCILINSSPKKILLYNKTKRKNNLH